MEDDLCASGRSYFHRQTAEPLSKCARDQSPFLKTQAYLKLPTSREDAPTANNPLDPREPTVAVSEVFSYFEPRLQSECERIRLS